ncbi:MAG: hypothetical protein AAF390_21365 [Pseudomonadota bacterium]
MRGAIMSETTRYRGGRAIAAVLDKLGWLAALTGLGLAGYAVATAAGVDPVARIATGLPGTVLAIVGLAAVTIAQLTRVGIDTAVALRELVDLTRKRPQADPAARSALREAALHAPPPAADALAPALIAPMSDDAPKLAARRPVRKDAKIHPIFSARPPRSS